MKSPSALLSALAAAAVWGMCVAACSPGEGPNAGTQTNWLRSCQHDTDCGELRCICGACTRSCEGADTCTDLPEASCIAAEDTGTVALCAGRRPAEPGLCLVSCLLDDCPSGTSCVAGVCTPTPVPAVHVFVDDTQRYQSFVGLGASLAYIYDEVLRHPRKAELFDAMFADSGLTVLRLRNDYVRGESEDLGSSSEVVSAATERLGRPPTILLNSASPPDALKANGSIWCEGNPDTCTLTKLPDGSFDYLGLATHLRESLEAYALAGIEPQYLSIQNNPNWVPPAGSFIEACMFLPTEGTRTVTTSAGTTEVDYPGYAEALEAVVAEIRELAAVPRITAPETSGHAEVAEYLAALDMTNVGAIAHHLYGADAKNLDLEALEALGELGRAYQRPLFQSEMHVEPLPTAVLLHAALAVEGASVYIQNGFLASADSIEGDNGTLIMLTQDDFELGDAYHVMRHYGGHVGSGWTRVAANADSNGVLASAWLSPDGEALAVVLTNPDPVAKAVEIDLSQFAPMASMVIRSALGGTERSASLGALPPDGILSLPGQSIATVVVER